MVRVGVDTGGTFTDFVLLGPEGLRVHKLRSTPDDPARSILAGLEELAAGRTELDVVHGSTVATNAVLERKGARIALLATAGFEDVLRIGRQTRRELYNFMVEGRRPLVDENLVFGVDERIGADGEVLRPVDPSQIDALAAALIAEDVEAVAVCLLHSYRNPDHERLVAARLVERRLLVSASHQVLSEYREFERWSTTVVNAYVTPLMSRYLGALERRLGGRRLRIMQSNGGSISAAAAKARAVQTILSGPAAGVVGARAVAEAAGYDRAISFDMGGTSTDVSLIDGAIGVTTESTVGDLPIRLPVIDIHTVGAGGGSIAYIDSGGALRVGPRSAGADPGPICYGTGTELTVTDANLLLGRLDPQMFLGGRMVLDVERTRRFAREFARTLDMTETELAEGVIRIAVANMERAIRVVSIQRGFDPREFALVAFGGAGGMHACEIAEKLDIETVIAPRHAGVLSALGMLLTDVTKDYSLTILRSGENVDEPELRPLFEPLAERAREELRAEGFTGARALLEYSLDVRYVGQSYEIQVPLGAAFRDEFDRRHERLYGYANPRRPIEIVNLRLKAIGVTDKAELPRSKPRKVRAVAAATRKAWFGGRRMKLAAFHRDDVPAGAVGRGPAMLAGGEATTIVPPGFRFQIDRFGNVVATRSVARRSARSVARRSARAGGETADRPRKER